jgi:RHH-type proline utilization regulon transcriptional repressor/proline dehydrogenase/delta 1-pyrroline-5-carboxylate dehydrogenase
MSFGGAIPPDDPLRDKIGRMTLDDETRCVEALLREADPGQLVRNRITGHALRLAERVRSGMMAKGGLDAFMLRYDLSTQEGVFLMCLAEALLRIPDAATADRLIAEKIGAVDWQQHLGESGSVFVNASTWALMLSGRIVRLEQPETGDVGTFVRRLAARSGEPLIRQALRQAMRIIGRQFVMGRTIGEALNRAAADAADGVTHSFDMLGESALTTADARRYFDAYAAAIVAVGQASARRGPWLGPGVSIKLSALHPRFEASQRGRLATELVPAVRALAEQASRLQIGLCIDTEEADRLDITLDVVEALVAEPSLAGWNGLGLAVQAYQKRTRPVIDWLQTIARRQQRRIAVRLVKGAYWDTEIKRAQEQGLDDYSVFTRKANTDVAYLACARALLADPVAFRPAFATHNAQTAASIAELAGDNTDFEFQRLHGMGEALHEALRDDGGKRHSCRVYAPVGSHEELLCYLVRRLLENGANTSFINRMVHQQQPLAAVVSDPVETVLALTEKRHPCICRPRDVFGTERLAARGIDLSDPVALRSLAEAMQRSAGPWSAAPLVGGTTRGGGEPRAVHFPADLTRIVGEVTDADEAAVEAAMRRAEDAADGWDATAVMTRADCLDRCADRIEAAMPEWVSMLVLEAGKTIADALAEVREAVDFCRYYAVRARQGLAEPTVLSGPTGETNRLSLHGRGVIVCISPWNFPLSIFLGQVTAALVAGNAVVAKPAEQTPLIAMRATRLLLDSGVPGDVVHCLPGDGGIGALIVRHPATAGVAFTGALDTARVIQRGIAERSGPIVPLIAETGGVNVMLVDSSALPEQVVTDVVTSAFRSAGQRCSALRVLFLQREIAPRIVDMLVGAMSELRIGDPRWIATDVGPLIDADSLERIRDHTRRMADGSRLLHAATLPKECGKGTFYPPTACRVERLSEVSGEVFGPVLHVAEFARDQLDGVLDAIRSAGYGLTLGIHSRIDGFIRRVHSRLRVGNTYVNRSMIGALVGVQPFGGEGLSGTGPKAGGPQYLTRFTTERVLTVNTAAAGGNPMLFALTAAEDDLPPNRTQMVATAAERR